MKSNDPPEIDLDRLLDMASGCGWTLVEFVDFYEPRARTELVELQRVLSAEDRDAVERLAHGAEGSSASIGLTSLSALYRQISTRARVAAIAELERLAVDAGRHLDRVLARLLDLARTQS